MGILLAAWRALRRRPLPPPPPDGFTIGRTGTAGQLVAALLVVTAFEAPALHLILHARLGPGHALLQLALGALHLYGVAWLVGDLRLVREAGHRVSADALELRLGTRWRGEVPYERITSVALGEPRAGDRDTLRLSALDRPRVLVVLASPIELVGPIGIRRRAARLALSVDEPRAFVDALQRRLAEQRAAGTCAA
jgi:hypothetical protein